MLYIVRYVKRCVFNCFLNESKQLVNLMSAGRLFHTAGPPTAKALSPCKVFVERLGSVNRPAVDVMADTEADRSVARLSVVTTGTHICVM